MSFSVAPLLIPDEHLSCKVTDFGMAATKTSTNSSKIRPETGALRFVAPERYKRGTRIGEPSDMFAFAMTFYQIIVGKLPFYEGTTNILRVESNQEIVKEWIKDGERPFKLERMQDDIWQLIEKAWRQVPEDRPTFKEMAEEIT